MFTVKKFLFFLFSLSFLFLIGSQANFIGKAQAASYNLNIGAVMDNGNRNFNTTNTDHCYDGTFKVTITDASGTRTISKDSQENCVSSFLNTSVTLRVNDPDLYELGEDYFRITLTAPNRDLNFIYIYNFTSSDTKRDNSKTANITAGHKQIVFGIKPYCNESVTTNCIKCSSNSQCSSNATFKYCAPTTDRCSDLTTYKQSLCRQNNYCGTFTVGGTSLACGGCGNGNSCNTNTHTCVSTPNCTTAVKLGKCEPKSGRPQGNGSACSSIAGTQTRTFTDRPGFSTCKETATTPQDCTPNATDVCSSGICSIGKCVQCTTSNLKNCTSGQFCNSSNKCETRANQKTLSFTGYVFIDEDGNGRKGDTELFYKDPYIVQADSTVNSTLTGFAYDLKRTTTASQVNVRLIVPSGYTATKLNYQDFVGGNAITASVDGSSKTFSANNTVNFGIKKTQANGATKDLVISAFNFPGGVDTGNSNPTVKIKNIGNTQITGDFKVRVINRDGGAVKLWTVTQVVSANEEIDLSSHFTGMPRPAAGKYKAVAFVDSEGKISETNEGNNIVQDSYETTKSGGGTGGGTSTTPQPTCDKNAPTLDITPNSRNGNPGDEREYSVKVTNNDKGEACNPVSFVLSKERLPNDNWTASFTDNTLSSISKNGGNKSTTFKVKSPNGATQGPKTFTLGVRREGQTTAQVQVNATYTVNVANPTDTPTTCTRKDPEFTVTPDSQEANPGQEASYSIEILNKDTGECSPKTLSLTANLPNTNWEATFGKNSPFELAQGDKQITNVKIKSPTNATAGTKKITLNIKNPNNTIIATKDIAYVVPGDQTNECVQNNPEFSITPQTKTGNPSEAVTYNVTVRNIDQGDCAGRTFSIEATPPTGWSASLSQDNLSNISKNESRDVNVVITSPSNSTTGEHITVLKLIENNTEISSIVAVYLVQDQITPIPGKTYLNFRIGIDGIGSTPRIPIGGNKNPTNIWRGLNFKIYNTITNTLSFTGTNITFTYNQNSEKFELLYDLPSVENLPNGSYNIYVDGPGYLTNQYPGSFSITQGQVTDLTSNNFYLITGNVNNTDLSENRIDLMDYNLLLSCSVYSQNRSACDADENNEKYTDLNDDGFVNEDDYTLFLKEFANQQGVILPE